MTVLAKLIKLDPRCEVPYNDFHFNHYDKGACCMATSAKIMRRLPITQKP